MADLDPQHVLAEVDRRRQQTLAEGSAPWPRRYVALLVVACLTTGAAHDADMNWLVPWLVVLVVLGAQLRGVQLPRTRNSRWWAVALGAALVGSAWLGIIVMHLGRATGWALPGTIGGVAAALSVVLVVHPVQVRAARSRWR